MGRQVLHVLRSIDAACRDPARHAAALVPLPVVALQRAVRAAVGDSLPGDRPERQRRVDLPQRGFWRQSCFQFRLCCHGGCAVDSQAADRQDAVGRLSGLWTINNSFTSVSLISGRAELGLLGALVVSLAAIGCLFGSKTIACTIHRSVRFQPVLARHASAFGVSFTHVAYDEMTLQPSAAADRTLLELMQILDGVNDATPSIKEESQDPIPSPIQSLHPQCLDNTNLMSISGDHPSSTIAVEAAISAKLYIRDPRWKGMNVSTTRGVG